MELLKVKSDLIDEHTREQFFIWLYESSFPAVARFIHQRQGSLQDAKDIFQDALVIYYEKTVRNEISEIHSEQGYLVGIAKHLWIKKYAKEKEFISLATMEQAIQLPEEEFNEIESSKLLALLERSGKKCLELLKAFYYDNLPMEKMRQLLGFGSVRSATVQKFKCLEKVRDTVKEKSLTYEDFTG